MLEKPDLDDGAIIACLQAQYGLRAAQVEFLPLGADMNTAVYRVAGDDETPYFLKLRRGAFDETAVTLPRSLYEQGIQHIIPPLPNLHGALWSPLEGFTSIVYPFVEGRNGYQTELTERLWLELGISLRRIHTITVPSPLANRLPRETFAPTWREQVREFQAQVTRETFNDPISARLAALLKAKRDVIDDLLARAERHAAAIQLHPLPFVVCHADIHAANLLIRADGTFYIVDWDTLILAPKERDLMYIGGGQMADYRTPQEEEALFYAGYGKIEVDQAALAYYRYERIVEDIASYSHEILASDKGDLDRAEGLHRLSGQFAPDGIIAFTYGIDRT